MGATEVGRTEGRGVAWIFGFSRRTVFEMRDALQERADRC